MKKLSFTLVIICFSMGLSAQIITHTSTQYEIRTTDDKGVESKKIFPYKGHLFYSSFCEEATHNVMIIDLYHADGTTESLLFDIQSKETNKEKKSTTLFAKLSGTDSDSRFYSGDKQVIMVFTKTVLGIGFLNCELYLRNYSTTIEY